MCGEPFIAEEFARVLREAYAAFEPEYVPPWIVPVGPPAPTPPRGEELVALVRQAGGLK